MINNTYLIWDLQNQPLWQTLPIQVMVILARIYGPNSTKVENVNWKMHPLLADHLICEFSQVVTMSLTTLFAKEMPKEMPYTFGGKPLVRDPLMEPHSILLFSGEEELLRIINVGHRETI